MQVQVHRVISTYVRQDVQMAQVVVLRGKGSDRRSETRHIRFNGKTEDWIGSNPDPSAIGFHENASKVLRFAEDNLQETESVLKILRASLSRSLTDTDMSPFHAHGIHTEDEAKVAIQKRVIPFVELQLTSARMKVDSAKATKASVEEIHPLTVEFIGGGL